MEMHREYRYRNNATAVINSDTSNTSSSSSNSSSSSSSSSSNSSISSNSINNTSSSDSNISSEEDEKLLLLDCELALIVDKVCTDMTAVARTLPYTDDRALLSKGFRAAIEPLQAIAHTLLLLPDDSEQERPEQQQETEQETEQEVSEEHKYGVCNLRDALQEADNCLKDIDEMRPAVSTMEYF